jgi:hypothetical protein
MLKNFILAILALSIISCSVKNPFNKKSSYSYLECPQLLIIAKASSINYEDQDIKISKDVSQSCYTTAESEDVFIDISYFLENLQSEDPIELNFNFYAFLTDKDEDTKINEFKFNNLITDPNQSQLEHQITINKDVFQKGVKIFIGITE